MIFNNTIIDCEWLKYKNFSPGSWACDYAYLYTLFRVLNDMQWMITKEMAKKRQYRK